MEADQDPASTGPETAEPIKGARSRRILILKAAGLLIVMAVVGIALLLVIWLLVTIVASLIASL